MGVILASTSLSDGGTNTGVGYPYDASDTVQATCATAPRPPNQACQVNLQLSADGVNWFNGERKWFGLGPSITYYAVFNMADYAGLPIAYGLVGPWTQFRLVFTGNVGAAVTIAASDSDPIEIATVTLAGTTATTGGVLGSFTPPQGGPILITNLVIYSTANSTGAANISAGVAANATTNSVTLVNAQAWAPRPTPPSSRARARRPRSALLTGTQAVTFTGSANSSGYAGKAYITYIKP